MTSKYAQFFKYIGEDAVDNTKYTVYQPYGFPLILKNYQGRVLASLQIFYDDEPIETQTYPIPVPYEDSFQIIFQSKEGDDRIEKGRPIKYVITNHCQEQGYVKIDLGEEPNTILVRCGHICTCSKDCTDMLGDNCPICRAKILHRIDESLFIKKE
jgi:hypothetical protein